MTSVTIKTIAREAGVHHSTVSRVLNNRSVPIPEATREKIRRVAEKLHYQKHRLASHLKEGLGDLAVLICEDFVRVNPNPLYLEMIAHLQAELGRNKRYLAFHQYTDATREMILENMDSSVYKGILLLGRGEVEGLEELASRLPVLQLWHERPEKKVSQMLYDHEQRFRVAASHLQEHGRKNVAVFSLDWTGTATYMKAYEKTSREFKNMNFTFEIVGDYFKRFIRPDLADALAPFDAVIFQGGWATRFYFDCLARGIDIPQKLSLIGLDYMAANQHMVPELTVVGLDYAAMAKTALSFFEGKPKQTVLKIPSDLYPGKTVQGSRRERTT
ncbi:MAG: LacI family DNA-binding transcriptional regulator [Spirochaetia bacterium]|nr:LacI family DNA-binding transcriptional regulator [Spirochaetia bacterium]